MQICAKVAFAFLHSLIISINTELEKVKNWLASNKLTLNIEKTNFMIVQRNKNIPDNIPSIKIGNKSVREAESVKFLGIMVDRQLSWNVHIQNVTNKLNKQCGILYLTWDSLNVNAMKMVYYSLIYPFLTYCHTGWGATGKSKLKSIEVSLKKIIRISTYKSK